MGSVNRITPACSGTRGFIVLSRERKTKRDQPIRSHGRETVGFG